MEMNIIVKDVLYYYDEPVLFTGYMQQIDILDMSYESLKGNLFFLKDSEDSYIVWRASDELIKQVKESKVTLFDAIPSTCICLQLDKANDRWKVEFYSKDKIRDRLPEKGVFLRRTP